MKIEINLKNLGTNKEYFEKIALRKSWEYNFVDESCVEIDIYDADDIAEELDLMDYYICELTSYGQTELEVVGFNPITEDWEHYLTYKCEISRITESGYGFGSRETAKEVLEKMKKDTLKNK